MKKIINIALISMLMGGADLSYSSDISCLRVPIEPGTCNRLVESIQKVKESNDLASVEFDRIANELVSHFKKNIRPVIDKTAPTILIVTNLHVGVAKLSAVSDFALCGKFGKAKEELEIYILMIKEVFSDEKNLLKWAEILKDDKKDEGRQSAGQDLIDNHEFRHELVSVMKEYLVYLEEQDKKLDNLMVYLPEVNETSVPEDSIGRKDIRKSL